MVIDKTKFDFSFVEGEVRSKTFGILTTLEEDRIPHTTGILYGVSSPEMPFALYFLTSKKYKKVQNIKRNPNASFLIPFPHHVLRFVPANTVMFKGSISIESVDNHKITEIFMKKRILRMMIEQMTEEEKKDYVFLKLTPNPKVFCYGLGINMFKLRGKHTQGGYTVSIPSI